MPSFPWSPKRATLRGKFCRARLVAHCSHRFESRAAPAPPPAPAPLPTKAARDQTWSPPALRFNPAGFAVELHWGILCPYRRAALGSQAYWIALNQSPRWHAQGRLFWGGPSWVSSVNEHVADLWLISGASEPESAASVTCSIKAQGKALLQMHKDRHKGSGKVSRWALQSGRWDAAAAAPSVLPWPAMAVSIGNLGYDGRSRAEIETENKN